MIYQFTTPTFYLLACFAVCSLWRRRRLACFSLCAGALTAGSLILAFAQNSKQVAITASERLLRDRIAEEVAAAYASGAKGNLQFIVRPAPDFTWYSSDSLSAVYAQTWFRRDDISFRMLPTEPLTGPYASYWPVIFAEDFLGVRNAKLWGISSPYENTRFLAAGPRNISVLDTIRPEDLKGFQAQWDRQSPTAQFPKQPIGCVSKWTADNEYLGSGLSAVEFNKDRPYRWSVARKAEIDMPRPCASVSGLELRVAFAMTEKNLDGLRLRIWGKSIPVRREAAADGGYRFTAMLNAEFLQKHHGPVALDIAVPSLDSVTGPDTRQFGVEIESVEWLSP